LLHYGLDIHRRFTNYCVMDDAGVILSEGRCPTEELARHPAFSLKGRKRAVLEAGGNWHFVFDMLEPVVDEVLLAHPLRVRAIAAARVKTDAIDARTLAHLLRSDLIPAAYVPPPKVREAREIFRFRFDLVKQRSSLKNRVHALLAKEGLTSPVTDLFGRHGRAWLAEAPLGPNQRWRLESYLRVLDQLTDEIRRGEAIIRQRVELDGQARLLTSIPGVGPLIAMVILAEIGDVTRFPDANHLVSYAGLAPRVRSSGGKTRLGGITKQGSSALRWALVEAAIVAVRRPGRLQEMHKRLRQGKSAALAMTACARQLLVVIYHMLTRGDAYQPAGTRTMY
jgi:transposase